jgi:hypothetical protein
MRQEFVLDLSLSRSASRSVDRNETPDDRYARKVCPWATRVAKVDAGYMCFESETDYLLWKHQR